MGHFPQQFHTHSVKTYCLELGTPQTQSSSNGSSLDTQSQNTCIHLDQKDRQRGIRFQVVAQLKQISDPHEPIAR